jgi:hypothetical protein
MVRGQSIRVFLADGVVTGIRHAEVVNWTGQALACPRIRVAELSGWDEANRPGVYLLLGIDDVSGAPAVYIGEAENVMDRLQSHLSQKDFWTEIVLFSNKDENLTKAHVRYLEAQLTVLAKAANRYVVKNLNQPQPALLPRGDRDAMESFLEQMRLLLGVLGHRVLEPLASQPISPRPQPTAGSVPSAHSPDGVFTYSGKGLQANALLTSEGVVVLANSRAVAVATDSISGGYRKLREQLIQQGILVPDGEALRFTQDTLFSSPSAAAVVVVGYPINGREAWKDSQGRSIADIEGQIGGRM